MVTLTMVTFGCWLPAFADSSVCPDMSENMRILDQGEKTYRENGGGPGIESTFEAIDSSWERTVTDSAPAPTVTKDDIEKIRLKSIQDLDYGSSQAKTYECNGQFELAGLLYARILQSWLTRKDPDADAMKQVRIALERITAFERGTSTSPQIPWEARLASLNETLESVSHGDSHLDLQTKLSYASAVAIKAVAGYRYNGQAADVLKKADQLRDFCKRGLACLGMAENLDETASKLERQGSYDMADKLFKQELDIKQKNLGFGSAETLTVYADLARVCDERNQSTQAKEYYEKAVSGFRDIKNPGIEYVRVLESYADMLNRTHEYPKSDQLYSEAKNRTTANAGSR
ncbi:MAG TPA: tetratricopeptide repeat protein [Planktothrix sp.]